MRYQPWSLAAAGASGLGAVLAHFMPPIFGSVTVGGIVGLWLSWGVKRRGLPVAQAIQAELPLVVDPAETPEGRSRRRAAERDRMLDGFDSLLARVVKVADPAASREVAVKFEDLVDLMTVYCPEWDAAGRLRTFVLMKKIADSLNLRGTDHYLEIAYRLLLTRGAEATEMSRLTLGDKLEEMYRDPWNLGAPRMAGTLMLMNKEEDEYAKELIVEAIHLWSDERFQRMKEELATVSILGREQERSALDLLEKEISKSRLANDPVVAKRAKEIWVAIQTTDPWPATLRYSAKSD